MMLISVITLEMKGSTDFLTRQRWNASVPLLWYLKMVSQKNRLYAYNHFILSFAKRTLSSDQTVVRIRILC